MKCVRIYARKTIHSTGRYEALDNYLTSLEAKFDTWAHFSASTLMTLGDGTTSETEGEHSLIKRCKSSGWNLNASSQMTTALEKDRETHKRRKADQDRTAHINNIKHNDINKP
eukprot:g46300.t1